MNTDYRRKAGTLLKMAKRGAILYLLVHLGHAGIFTQKMTPYKKLLKQAIELEKHGLPKSKVELYFWLAQDRAYLDGKEREKALAHYYWGKFLLASKDLDGAREQFTLSLSHNKGPPSLSINYLGRYHLALIDLWQGKRPSSCHFFGQGTHCTSRPFGPRAAFPLDIKNATPTQPI